MKDFRLISLTFFVLKLLERLTDRYLREVSFVENHLRKEQHAYQEGKSAKTALPEVVTEIEKCIKSGFDLTVLLDIEGAFNHVCGEHLPGCQGARCSRNSGKVDVAPAGQQEGGRGMETAQTRSLGW